MLDGDALLPPELLRNHEGEGLSPERVERMGDPNQ